MTTKKLSRHEETPQTSPLFTAVLLLAFGVLLTSALVGSSNAIAESPVAESYSQ